MFSLRLLILVAAFAAKSVSAVEIMNPSTFFSGNADDISDYLDWVNTVGVNYRGMYYLPSDMDPADGAAIHWNIDEELGILELAVAVHATGWLGFGISENGGMLGSDMLIFETLDPTTIKDAHVKDYRYPETDSCQSWELISSSTDTEFLIVEMRRELNTLDSQDWALKNDANVNMPPRRVIAAWGDEPYMGYHGARNARSSLRWFAFGKDEFLQFRSTMAKKASGTFDFVQTNYNLLPIETRYHQMCISARDMRAQNLPFDEGFTLVGFEPIITSKWVHHYTLFGSSDGCGFHRSSSMDQLYSWSPGEPPLKYPDGIGITAGGENGFKTFIIEFHYNNPDLSSGLYDNSGVKFYYSMDPPEYEAGVFRMGDPLIDLMHQPVGLGLTQHNFECHASCTQAFLADAPVTVFKDKLHMHASGTSMFTEHIRDGKVIRTHRVQYFDFDQMGAQIMIEEPYQIQAGDSFKTSCIYNNQDEEKVFGMGSEDEMCIHLMMYYPRRHLGSSPFICGPGMPIGEPTECEGTYKRVEENEVIQNSMDFVRPFGVPASVCHLLEEEEEVLIVDEQPQKPTALNNTATVVLNQKPITQDETTVVPAPKATTTQNKTKAATAPSVPTA